ncbi:MAG: methionyl-tRNA formyltransferase [Kiritimatiellae bacterium]|nr:methionyl-tRNA formyltransferase [Kiritimatiellia bacterium]
MRVLFFGSGALGCPSLERILASDRHTLVAAVTSPDRPGGRHLQPMACPARQFLLDRGIPMLTPERVNAPEVAAELEVFAPDLVVSAAYGQFLGARLLNLAPRGAINVHPSLLPKYRGAAPVAWAIARGETVTGVTILRMTRQMDAGDMILQETHPVHPDDTAETLERRLAAQGASLLMRALDILDRDVPPPATPQDESQATFAPKLTKQDGWLDWNRPARELSNRIRGFQPWPGSYTLLPGPPPLRLGVLNAEATDGRGRPGEVLRADREGLDVATSEGVLRIRTVHPAGRKPMDAGAFCLGCRDLAGRVLELPVGS